MTHEPRAQHRDAGDAGPRRASLRRAAVRPRLPLSGLVAGIVMMCGCTPAEPTPARATGSTHGTQVEAPAQAQTPAESAPGVRPDGEVVSAVAWIEGTVDDALDQARGAGKLTLVEVGAYWCPPCHRMDEEVFVQPEVAAAIAEHFVAVRVDAEAGAGPEVVARYRVQAYPTLLVLDPDGLERGRVVDFVPATELLAQLATIRSGGSPIAALVDRVEQHPDDLEATFQLAHAYALSARGGDALALYARLLDADPAGELGLAPRVWLDRASFVTHKLDGDVPRAIAELRTLQRRFPGAPEALRAHRAIGRLLQQQGDGAAAIAELERWVEAAPEDVTAYQNAGWFAFRERCEPARGLALVRRGLALAPDDAELHYLAGELHAALGELPAASAAMAKASELQPRSAFYRRQARRFAEASP